MRVYISGIGIVSPLGIGREHNWESLLGSTTRVEMIPESWRQYADFNTTFWSPLPELKYSDFGIRKAETLQLDPTALLTQITVQEALDHACIELNLKDKKRNTYSLDGLNSSEISVCFGAGFGGGSSLLAAHSAYLLSAIRKELLNNDEISPSPTLERLLQNRRFNPFAVSMMMGNSIPVNMALKYSITGAVLPVVQACSSGTTALGMSVNLIKSGRAKMVVSGGAEYAKDEFGTCFYGFDLARTLATQDGHKSLNQVNRPFDVERNGFLYAEGGAATLILESEEHLDKRGGQPIAEIVGFGETFDAYSIMAPDPSGIQIERMIHMSLNDAGIAANDIDYINTHGTGTVANDKTEVEVIERVFRKGVAINSTKSLIGHTFGASGAIEAAVCALSLRDQELHPSLNLENPISRHDFVTERRKTNLKYVLSESFAFGGHNSGVVLKAV